MNNRLTDYKCVDEVMFDLTMKEYADNIKLNTDRVTELTRHAIARTKDESFVFIMSTVNTIMRKE